MSTTDKSERVMEMASTTRYCIEPGCGKRLSQYNTGKKCFHHPSKARAQTIGMSSVHNKLPVWTPTLLYPPPKPHTEHQMQPLAVPALPAPATPQPRSEFVPPGQKILEEVCKFFIIKETEMTGPCRMRYVTHARQVLMYLLATDLKKSSVAIGMMFNRNHATVLHAIDKIDYALKRNSELQRNIATIRSRLQKPPS